MRFKMLFRTSYRWLLLMMLFVLPFALSTVTQSVVLAQGVTQCPANVLLAFGRAGAACTRTELGEICYGNGALQASLRDEQATLAQPGQRAQLDAIEWLQLASEVENNTWSVANLQLQLGNDPRGVGVLAYGNVRIENNVQPTPRVRVEAAALLNVRVLPAPDADIIEQFGIRTPLTASGRTEDGAWLRVTLPDSDQLGWVSAQLVNAIGDLDTLNVVTVDQRIRRAFEDMTIRTGDADAFCAGTPTSGVLIQTPSVESPFALTVNGHALRLAATVLLQTQGDDLMVTTLDGSVEIRGDAEPIYVGAGAQSRVSAGGATAAAPYDLAAVQGVPLNNLAVRFGLPQPVAAGDTPQWALVPTPVPTADPAIAAGRCTYTITRNSSLFAGPGSIYEVINEVQAGQRVFPVLETQDADGNTWWQLNTSNWVRAINVEASDACTPVPRSQVVEAPAYNSLSLETCETGNGPLRAGQRVTISFVPPSWPTYEEAQLATRVSPGAVIIDNRQYVPTYASRPIRVAEEAWIREFSAVWTAEPGTRRIVGARRSYLLICNLTIPLGP